MFKGEVEAFDATRQLRTARTLMVRGRVPNPDRKLLPGMFANVAVLAGEPKDVVTVPRTALTYGLYGDSVWVVKEGWPSRRDPADASTEPGVGRAAVRRGRCRSPSSPSSGASCGSDRHEGDRVAILEGVKAGEQVVTSGQLKLQPDATIKIDNIEAL